MPASRRPARSRHFLVKLPFAATCRSASPISPSVAPASSGRPKPHRPRAHRKDRNMRMLRLRDGNSLLVLVLAVALSTLVLAGCNVKVNKDSEGQGKKVDIETPIGGLHVSKGADVRDTGLPVYP